MSVQTKMTNHFKPVEPSSESSTSSTLIAKPKKKSSDEQSAEQFMCFSNILAQRKGKRKSTDSDKQKEESGAKKANLEDVKQTQESSASTVSQKHDPFFSKKTTSAPVSNRRPMLQREEMVQVESKIQIQVIAAHKPNFGTMILDGKGRC